MTKNLMFIILCILLFLTYFPDFFSGGMLGGGKES